MASTGSNSSVQEADVGATRADIVVTLTSHNDARTIGAVARALQDGLSRSFASSATRFVLADAGSTDGTLEIAREAIGQVGLVEVEYDRGAKLDELPYHGQPGRAAALRAILQAAQGLSAKACVVFDASLHSIQPDWIERLAAPVLSDGFD